MKHNTSLQHLYDGYLNRPAWANWTSVGTGELLDRHHPAAVWIRWMDATRLDDGRVPR